MEQEKWINEILESTKEMHKAEPSPFLFEQVISKIRSGNHKMEHSAHNNSAFRWGMAGFVALIIMCNMLSLVLNNANKSHKDETLIKNETYFNNATIYNY